MTELFQTKRPTNPAAEELVGKYFPVFNDDASFVALWDYMGTDQCVETAARVSYSGGTRKVNQTRGLIRHLKRHAHSSPSEMIELKFHCSMPIFIARQTIRHRTFNINEVSGRYSLLPMLFYTPPQDQFRAQSKSNNQGRGEQMDSTRYNAAVEAWNKNRAANKQLYEDLAADDVAREIARIDLPLSTYTQWIWKVDSHNLQHFLKLRVDPHAQWEVRQFANIIAGIFKQVAPLSYEAWVDYQLSAKTFSKQELKILTDFICVTKDNDGSLFFTTDDDKTRVSETQLPKRELNEFFAKLQPPEDYDFSLGLSQAKDFDYFKSKFEAATPKIDKGDKE